MVDKVDCQMIEQILVPRLALHRIGRMNDPVAHHPVPKSIDNGSRKSPVLRVGHQACELLQPLRLGRLCVDLPKLFKEPTGTGRLTNRLIATMDLQRAVRIDGRQSVSVLEGPAIDETIVA